MPPKLTDVRARMNKFADTANELYYDVMNDESCTDSQMVVDPVQWLYNQDQMRRMWEVMRKSKENPIAQFMFNTTLFKYMEHMYTKYPAGYGLRLRLAARSGRDVDTAKLYISCLRGKPVPNE